MVDWLDWLKLNQQYWEEAKKEKKYSQYNKQYNQNQN
jgi:hypothetical protein